MVQAAQQHHGQRGDRLVVGTRLGVGGQRDLAQIEFHRTGHAAERAGDRIDIDEIEADAI